MSEGRYFYRRGIGYLLETSSTKGIGLELCQFEDNVSLHILTLFGNLFIKLPHSIYKWIIRYSGEIPSGEIMCSWGFQWTWFGERAERIYFNWRDKCSIIYMPWAFRHVRHEVLMKDGKFKNREDMTYNEYQDEKYTEQHPYTYNLKDGILQYRLAKVGVEEREWRWKWLKCFLFIKIPFPRLLRRTIEVEFDYEVGEETGSWKGGCVGCGYEMKYDYDKGEYETPLQCLRRMEVERKF